MKVIINNSPYAYCHSLIVPEPDKHHIQFLTGETIETAIEIMMQSNQIGFKILFNSICGCASGYGLSTLKNFDWKFFPVGRKDYPVFNNPIKSKPSSSSTVLY